MQYTENQAKILLDQLQKHLAANEPDSLKIRRFWHEMITFRARVLASVMDHHLQTTVYSGPFRGMKLLPETIQQPDSCMSPVLLGVYEHELHPAIARAINAPFKNILNIGCAYGYYAVGFALRMPDVAVQAFDIDPERQRKCRALAALNGVEDRVITAGLFRGEDFARYDGQETLIFMDIEGAELDLLDPDRYPSLRNMTIVVELHDLLNPSISSIIKTRFAASHDIEMIKNKSILADVAFGPADKSYLDPFDQLLLTWENRGGPTPWGLLWPKSH